MDFEIGDIVDYMGLVGEVIIINTSSTSSYPLMVKFDNKNVHYFKMDGRYLADHKRTSLQLVKRK